MLRLGFFGTKTLQEGFGGRLLAFRWRPGFQCVHADCVRFLLVCVSSATKETLPICARSKAFVAGFKISRGLEQISDSVSHAPAPGRGFGNKV